MATTHPEYNEKTTATEVASAFADQIRGRNGQTYLIALKKNSQVYILTFLLSGDYWCRSQQFG